MKHKRTLFASIAAVSILGAGACATDDDPAPPNPIAKSTVAKTPPASGSATTAIRPTDPKTRPATPYAQPQAPNTGSATATEQSQSPHVDAIAPNTEPATTIGDSYPVGSIGSTLTVSDFDNTTADVTVSNPRYEGNQFVVDFDVVCRHTDNAFLPGQLSALTESGQRVEQLSNGGPVSNRPGGYVSNVMVTGQHDSGKIYFDTTEPITKIYMTGGVTIWAAEWDL